MKPLFEYFEHIGLVENTIYTNLHLEGTSFSDSHMYQYDTVFFNIRMNVVQNVFI